MTCNDLERPVLYAKMALLEYCGWLEASFDEIARNCVRQRLRTLKSRDILEEKIKNTHGFSYKTDVRPLLAHGVGVVRLLAIERELDRDGSIQRLSSDLGAMKKMRREAAHTFTTGRTIRFPAPSIIQQSFAKTEPTIQKLWTMVSC